MPLWKDQRFDYDSSGNIIYKGVSAVLNADTTMPYWYVWKYIYSGSNVSQIKGPVPGPWDGRAGLFD
jgi:hypothetical protein